MLIVGAGPMGLAQARALQKADIPYDHVEADEAIGGNWYHGTYPSLHTATPKTKTQFPEFAMPGSFPDFPSGAQVLDYLQSYADLFDLTGKIECNMKVVWVRPIEDDFWEVTFETGDLRHYKGVIVCNGRHWERRWPPCPGLFTGEFIHARDYGHADQLKDKRVLVIGNDTTACDLACEAASAATSVGLSLRRGTWILPKTLLGLPMMDFIHPLIPITIQTWIIRAALQISVGSYRQYGLPKPDLELFCRPPTVNGEILTQIRNGRVRPRPAVKSLSGNIVTFEDETREHYDTVVCATGYTLSYPFLPPQLAPVDGHQLQVFGGSMLPKYRNLYLPGSEDVRSGFGPIAAASAALVAKMIAVQDELRNPAGYIMLRMSAKNRDGRSVDPHILRLRIWRLSHSLWLMRLLDKHILTERIKRNEELEYTGPDLSHHKPTTVY